MGILDERFRRFGRHGGVRVLDSCSFTWVFDESYRRFRRVPRGAALDVPVPAEAWHAYHRVDLNDTGSSFAVIVAADGTTVFRCWLHRDPCPRCGPPGDSRLDIDELRSLAEGWKARIGIVEGGDRPEPACTPRSSVHPPSLRARPRREPLTGEA